MKTLNTVLLLSSASFVTAMIPNPRYNGGCVSLNQNIYCYGGTVNQQPTSEHFSLSLANDFSVAGSMDSWNSIAPANDFALEPNSLFSIVPLNNSYLIHGGLGYGNSSQFAKNITTVYNTNNNTWIALQVQNQSKMTPSREETSTLDPSNQIWIWGGISDSATLANITSTKYHNEFQVLDLNTLTWSFPDNNATSQLPNARLAHTATLVNDSIFYIGGLQISDDGKDLAGAPMDEILQYNIHTGNWTTQRSPENTTIPAARRLHTATSVPGTDLIFIYGGSVTDGSEAVADYSYLLNTTSFIWTPVNLVNKASTGAGSRFGHSAVLHNDKSLFILFGADDLGMLRNDFFVIDIVHWQWVSDFKVDGNYEFTAPSSSVSANLPAKTSSPVVNNNTPSSATSTSELPLVSINYMKTVYLMTGIVIFFSLL